MQADEAQIIGSGFNWVFLTPISCLVTAQRPLLTLDLKVGLLRLCFHHISHWSSSDSGCWPCALGIT